MMSRYLPVIEQMPESDIYNIPSCEDVREWQTIDWVHAALRFHVVKDIFLLLYETDRHPRDERHVRNILTCSEWSEWLCRMHAGGVICIAPSEFSTNNHELLTETGQKAVAAIIRIMYNLRF